MLHYNGDKKRSAALCMYIRDHMNLPYSRASTHGNRETPLNAAQLARAWSSAQEKSCDFVLAMCLARRSKYVHLLHDVSVYSTDRRGLAFFVRTVR